MPLPLTVSCFSKIQIGFTFLVPAHLGRPGKRAVKCVCVRACVRACVRVSVWECVCNSTSFSFTILTHMHSAKSRTKRHTKNTLKEVISLQIWAFIRLTQIVSFWACRCMLTHHEHGTGFRPSCSYCCRPLLFTVNWKHFCPSLPMDTRKTGDCFVMLPRSSVTVTVMMLTGSVVQCRVIREWHAPVELGCHDRLSAAETRQSWCESGPGTVLSTHANQTQRDLQTVQMQLLGLQNFPVSQLASVTVTTQISQSVHTHTPV